MNRTDRLLAIVLELQGKRRRRAEDLAATFETSKRTIYRDILALCEVGVPIVSTPGQGYALVEGYFLPPLRFTSDEATMLLLGSDVMADSFDAEYQAAAHSAGRKIAGALPADIQEPVEALRESIRFITMGALGGPGEAETLQQVRRAIIRRQTIRFRYHARRSEDGENAQSVRAADPYSLIHVAGVWQLLAYCHTRQAIRAFRLSRIEELALLETHFNRAEHSALWRQAACEHRSAEPSRSLVVRALFDHEVARWVSEDRLFYIAAKEQAADGLLVTLNVRHQRDVLQWLLSWGRHVQVLEPDTLRDLLAEEVEAMLANYKNPESLLT